MYLKARIPSKVEGAESKYEAALQFNQQICSPFYGVLMKQTTEERQAARKQMVQGITDFAAHLEWQNEKDVTISFFDSQPEPSIVDFCVFPFLHRLYIIEHYKGLVLPESTAAEKEVASKIRQWIAKMEARPSVQSTLAKPVDLIPIYLRYADGTAKSKVGDLVRKGQQAHDA